jgi:uncharacterized protein (DUF2141 family)
VTLAALALAAVLAQGRDAVPPGGQPASMSGTIATGDTPPSPVRRAVVSARSAADPRNAYTAVTDDAGRFTIGGLPPGRYTVVATKRGWVAASYGAKAPGRSGRSIPLAAGEQAAISLTMLKSAVISGTITDAGGGMPSGLVMRAMRYAYQPNSGERRLTTAGSTALGPDDRGQYRIFGLAPGEYYVTVAGSTGGFTAGSDLHLTSDVDVQEAMKAVDGGPYAAITDVPQRSVTFLSTFYPGTSSPAQATPIAVRAGEERTGVDFTVQYSGAVKIDGVVTGPNGDAMPAGAQVTLAANDPSMPMLGFEGVRTARPGPDGHFEFAQIAPGPYLLIARASLPPPEGSTVPQVYATAMDLDVQSEDQRGLSLALGDTLSVSGAVRFEGDGAAPPLKGLRVNLQPATTVAVTVSSGGAPVNSDGTFTITGIAPGRYHLSLLLPTPVTPWIVRTATLAGREALDGAVDVRQSLADATVTITDRIAELSGKVDAANGGDYTLVLFPQDHTLWTAPSRRITTARTAKDATFSFKRLPPGDYSLAAVDDVEPGEWYDPSFLQRLEPTAIKVTIGEGEKKIQDLHVGGGG